MGTSEMTNQEPAGVEVWRKTAQDWQQTAEMLAIDLGDIRIAFDLYADIKDGLYDKVRERLKGNL
jgi:hypothetical protein